MTTAMQYNEAVEKLAAVERHLQEIETGIAELEARNAKLEAALKEIAEHPHCKCCPHATTPYDRGLAEGHQAAAQLALAALTAVENDVTPTS